jgi:hypothetical protein
MGFQLYTTLPARQVMEEEINCLQPSAIGPGNLALYSYPRLLLAPCPCGYSSDVMPIGLRTGWSSFLLEPV